MIDRVAPQLLTEDLDFTTKVGDQSAEDLHGSGFSRAVGTDVTDYLPGGNLQVDVFEHLFGAVFFLKVLDADDGLWVHGVGIRDLKENKDKKISLSESGFAG